MARVGCTLFPLKSNIMTPFEVVVDFDTEDEDDSATGGVDAGPSVVAVVFLPSETTMLDTGGGIT